MFITATELIVGEFSISNNKVMKLWFDLGLLEDIG